MTHKVHPKEMIIPSELSEATIRELQRKWEKVMSSPVEIPIVKVGFPWETFFIALLVAPLLVLVLFILIAAVMQ